MILRNALMCAAVAVSLLSADGALLSSSLKLAHYPGEITEKNGWTLVGDSDGSWIVSPKFELNKKPEECAWYEFEFFSKCMTNGSWRVDAFDVNGKCIASVTDTLAPTGDGWRLQSVVVPMKAGSVAARLALGADNGMQSKNVVFRRIDVYEALAWYRNNKKESPEIDEYFSSRPKMPITVLENEALRLEFDGIRVRGLYDKKRNVQLINSDQNSRPLLGLKVKVPGGFAPTTDLTLLDAEVKSPVICGSTEEPELKLEYVFSNGIIAKPQAKLTNNGQIEWTISIDGAKDIEVCELDYPRLSGIAIGGDPKDDLTYCGTDWRQVWYNAYRRPSTKHCSANRFMIMWDECAAVYLGIEDPDQNDWWFWYSGDGFGCAQMGANQHPRINAGETWTGNGTVWRFAVTDGGTWHKAAAIAREYNLKTLQQPKVPEYVKWLADGWIYPNSNVFPREGWDVLNNLVADKWSARSFGTNAANWYADLPISAANRQMVDGPCAAYCGMYPYLSPVWGSEREFTEKRAISKALGEFYEPYINANLYSPAYTRKKRIGAFAKSLLPENAKVPDERWLDEIEMVNYDGTPYAAYNHLDGLDVRDFWMEEYPCGMMTRTWRNWLDYWFDMYTAKDWSDGIYIDQYNFTYENGRASEDYPDSYGAWLKSSREWLKDTKERSRKINPYVAYSGECANEITAQEIDLSMTSAVLDHHNIFKYAVPWAIIMDGKWNGGDVNKKFRFHWQTGARFGEGARPEYLALRKAVKSFLYDAEFRDGEDVVCRRDGQVVPERFPVDAKGDLRSPLNSGITAKWFLFRDGEQRGAVVNVVNCDEKGLPFKNVTVSVPTAEIGEVKAAWVLPLGSNGNCIKVRPHHDGDAGMVELDVPEVEAASIVLSNGKLRPLVAWDHDPVLTAGAKGKVVLKVTNVNDTPMTGEIKLRLPKEWKANEVKLGELQPGETRDVVVEYDVADNAMQGRYDFWTDVTFPTGTFSAYSYAVVNGPYLMDFRGVRGSWRIWFRNLTDKPIAGTLKGWGHGCGLDCKPVQDAVTIPPKSCIEVPVEVTGADKLQEYADVEVSFRTKQFGGFGQTQSRIRRIMPLLPNRDFEHNHENDMKPDWWMSRAGVSCEWSYECINLSTNSHSGQYALEIKPWDRMTSNIGANPTYYDAKPGATYKLSFWSKCETNATAAVLFAGSRFKIPASEDWIKTEETVTVKDVNWSWFSFYVSNGCILVDDIEIEEVR